MSKIISAPDHVGSDPRNITGSDLPEEGKRGLDVNVIKTTDSPETEFSNAQYKTRVVSKSLESILMDIDKKLDQINKNLKLMNDIPFEEEL